MWKGLLPVLLRAHRHAHDGVQLLPQGQPKRQFQTGFEETADVGIGNSVLPAASRGEGFWRFGRALRGIGTSLLCLPRTAPPHAPSQSLRQVSQTEEAALKTQGIDLLHLKVAASEPIAET